MGKPAGGAAVLFRPFELLIIPFFARLESGTKAVDMGGASGAGAVAGAGAASPAGWDGVVVRGGWSVGSPLGFEAVVGGTGAGAAISMSSDRA